MRIIIKYKEKCKILVLFLIFAISPLFSLNNTCSLSSQSLVLSEIKFDPILYPVPGFLHYPFDIAYNPLRTEFLVVWAQPTGDDYLLDDIYGAFIDEETGNVSKSFPITHFPSDQKWPTVAFDGINYLVVWADYSLPSWEIYGSFVDQNGNVYPQFRIRADDPAGRDLTNPSVAFNGQNYLVVWSGVYEITIANPVFRRMIAGIRIDRQGNHLDPVNRIISQIERDGNYLPNVSSDGVDFLVTWVIMGGELAARRVKGNNGIPQLPILSLSQTLPDSGRVPNQFLGRWKTRKNI